MIAAAHSHTSPGSDPFVALILTVIVLLVGYRISNHVAKVQRDNRFVKILMWSLVLHILCAPMQIWVVDHLYGGIADYNGYLGKGASLATNLRAGHFTFAGTRINGYTEDNLVDIVSGIAQTILGINKLAEFVFFSFVAFLGEIAFFRAFAVTFPEVNPRRYAFMLFFLPSMLFWTADISKETVMTISLGLGAYGAARLLQRMRGGFLLLIPGVVLGLLLRPNEVVLLVVGLAVALLFRGHDARRKLRAARRLSTFVIVGVLLVVAAVLTAKLLNKTGSSFTSSLTNIGKNNSSGTGAGFGSSSVPYSTNPLYYPRDIYTVLFDPLPVTAHGKGELLAGLENTVILVLILASLRQIRCVLRACRVRPYVLLCTVYSVLFVYVFAALGNLGLIYRERTLLLPFFLVILCIPVAPKGLPRRYPWERRLARRRDRRRALSSGAPPT
jgi:hypothetical protein